MGQTEFRKNTTTFLLITIIGNLLVGTVSGNLVRLVWRMMWESAGYAAYVVRYLESNSFVYGLIFGFGIPITLVCMLGAIAVTAYRFYVMWFALEDYNQSCRSNPSCSRLVTQNYAVVYILSCIVPLGIFRIVWFYQQGKNMQELARRNHKEIKTSGKSYLAMLLIPAILQWICGIMVVVMVAVVGSSDSASSYSGMFEQSIGGLAGVGIFAILYRIINIVRNCIMANIACATYVKNLYTVLDGTEVRRPVMDDMKNTVDREIRRDPRTPGKMPVVQPEAPTQAVGSVMVLTGQYKNALIPVKEGEEIILGRDKARCHLIFENPHVSRVHCGVRYTRRENQYIITDYSTNGTFRKDGGQFGKNQPTVCPRGTVVMLGRSGEEFIVR